MTLGRHPSLRPVPREGAAEIATSAVIARTADLAHYDTPAASRNGDRAGIVLSWRRDDENAPLDRAISFELRLLLRDWRKVWDGPRRNYRRGDWRHVRHPILAAGRVHDSQASHDDENGQRHHDG